MSEIITKGQLKRLIQEILKEVDQPTDYLTNSQKVEELIKSLIARGAKPNRSFRRYVSDLRYRAKQADADVIRGEVERTLAAQKRPDKRLDKYVEDEPEYKGPPPSNPPIPYTPEDWIKWGGSRKYASKLPPETRAKMSASAKARELKKQSKIPGMPETLNV
jgi:hypothetical protein